MIKPQPPFRMFDDDELVEWPCELLYESIADMSAVDDVIARGVADARPRDTLKEIRGLLAPLAEDGHFVPLADPSGNLGCLSLEQFAGLVYQTRSTERHYRETIAR
jgi:hypothetical protein